MSFGGQPYGAGGGSTSINIPSPDTQKEKHTTKASCSVQGSAQVLEVSVGKGL